MEKYPLNWPSNKPRRPAGERKRAQFSKKVHSGNSAETKQLSIADAVKRIEFELDAYTKVGQEYRVPPESIIISSNLGTNKKGIPRGDIGEPADPGVAVYFQLDDIPYCLPCDKWNRVADNLAAVAAHISALRGIERWGVGQQNDVYTGFKALPAQAGPSNGAWWLVLDIPMDADLTEIKEAYRLKSKYYHPDNPHTGNRDMFDIIKNAYDQAIKTKA